MRRDLYAQIGGSGHGVFRQPVQHLLPAPDQVQVGGVIETFVLGGVA